MKSRCLFFVLCIMIICCVTSAYCEDGDAIVPTEQPAPMIFDGPDSKVGKKSGHQINISLDPGSSTGEYTWWFLRKEGGSWKSFSFNNVNDVWEDIDTSSASPPVATTPWVKIRALAFENSPFLGFTLPEVFTEDVELYFVLDNQGTGELTIDESGVFSDSISNKLMLTQDPQPDMDVDANSLLSADTIFSIHQPGITVGGEQSATIQEGDPMVDLRFSLKPEDGTAFTDELFEWWILCNYQGYGSNIWFQFDLATAAWDFVTDADNNISNIDIFTINQSSGQKPLSEFVDSPTPGMAFLPSISKKVGTPLSFLPQGAYLFVFLIDNTLDNKLTLEQGSFWLASSTVIVTDACGDACGADETCHNGVCVDLNKNNDNCGQIGNACDTTGGEVCCSGFCRNVKNDVNHCGDCTNSCGFNQSCINGVCVDNFVPPPVDACNNTCLPGQTCCSGVCVDVANDPLNCGGCGKDCPEGQSCINGICVDNFVPPPVDACNNTCLPGQTCCSGACKDLKTDPDNCGQCGTICPEGFRSCENGLCYEGDDDGDGPGPGGGGDGD